MKTEGTLNGSENAVFKNEFSHCDSYNATQLDVILVYPDGKLKKDVGEICQRLQNMYDLLCLITPVSALPNQACQNRIIVGYRHEKDEPQCKECCAGWCPSQNRLNIPYSHLCNKDVHPIEVDLKDSLEFTCSHELVHPFEDVFLCYNQNKKWSDGFCDCLRVIVLDEVGFGQYASDWEKFIKTKVCSNKDKYWDAAARIYLWLENHDKGFRHDHAVLRRLIAGLIADSMDTTLDPNGEIDFS